jgi:hypothetical protein
MSKWMVEDIGIFDEAIVQFPQYSESYLSNLQEIGVLLDNLFSDIYADYQETLNEIEQRNQTKKEGKENDSNYNDQGASLDGRKFKLQGLLSEIEHMKIKFNSLQLKGSESMQVLMKSIEIFSQFILIGKQYLGTNSHVNSMNQGGRSVSKSHHEAYRFVGDTFHFSKENSLDEYTLSKFENSVMQSNQKGDKISIDKISQFDFAILESHGYTISEIGPNEYSAYKNIN